MTKGDDAFLATVHDKFIDVADWPNDRKVEFYTKIVEMVSDLADGTLARGKREGTVHKTPSPFVEIKHSPVQARVGEGEPTAASPEKK